MTKKKKKSAASIQPKTVASVPENSSSLTGVLKQNKASIIVLVLSAAVFVAALAWIHSEDFLGNVAEHFWEYGSEIVEFERGTVTEILSENIHPDDVMEDASAGTQKLMVIVESGQHKGESLVVYNYFGPLSGNPVSVGDSVVATIKTHTDGQLTATVYEFNRIPILIVFLIVFCAIVIVVGRLTGLKSLVGLFFTAICLFLILIPLILKGAPAVPTTFVICAYIALVSFTILGGVRRKTMGAFLGTVAGTFFAMVFGLAVQFIGKIDGLRLEDAEPLYQMIMLEGMPIDIRGLLVASVIICALGAVMDVAMSISSALEEIHAANPSLSQKELFASGMNVGRDMAGTMTNTLILALLGSEFALMIFLYARGLTFYYLFSTPFVAVETISGISSSLGMILAIPLTALIASMLIAKGRARDKSK